MNTYAIGNAGREWTTIDKGDRQVSIKENSDVNETFYLKKYIYK